MNAPRQCMGFSGPITAIIIGARGGIGAAFAEAIEQHHPEMWCGVRHEMRGHWRHERAVSVDLTNEEASCPLSPV